MLAGSGNTTAPPNHGVLVPLLHLDMVVGPNRRTVGKVARLVGVLGLQIRRNSIHVHADQEPGLVL